MSRIRMLAIAALVSLVAVLPEARAGGGATCSFSGGVVQVELLQDDASGTLVRTGAAILFDEGGSPPPQNCGAATIVNTDAIEVRDTSNDEDTGIIFDLSGGHFEDSGDEIPISINLRRGGADTVAVIGTSGDDFFTFGQDGGNLQEDEEAEIVLERLPDVVVALTRGGADRACSRGGHGTGSVALYSSIFDGGADDDVLCGGKVTDSLVGAAGNDTAKGSGGGDIIQGKTGNDDLSGNSATDLLKGQGGDDRLDGGFGLDTCNGGEGDDTRIDCEG